MDNKNPSIYSYFIQVSKIPPKFDLICIQYIHIENVLRLDTWGTP